MARPGRGYVNRAVVVRGLSVFDQTITPTGITSEEAFGSPVVVADQEIAPSGIASAEAFGTAQLNLTVTPTGIASAEAFGSPSIAMVVSPSGIASSEAWGTPEVFTTQFITVTGIASTEAFGTPVLSVGYPQTVTVVGIASAEYFWPPEVSNLSQFVLRPPTVQETPMGENVLHIRFGIHRGISILKRANGTYYSTRYPAQTEVEEALATYMGGHVYVVSKTVRDELIAAGYGSNVTLEEVS